MKQKIYKLYNYLVFDSSFYALFCSSFAVAKYLINLAFRRKIPTTIFMNLKLPLLIDSGKQNYCLSGRYCLNKEGILRVARRSLIASASDDFRGRFNKKMFINVAGGGGRSSGFGELNVRLGFYKCMITSVYNQFGKCDFTFLEPVSSHSSKVIEMISAKLIDFCADNEFNNCNIEVISTNELDFIYQATEACSYSVGRIGVNATLAMMTGRPLTIFYDIEGVQLLIRQAICDLIAESKNLSNSESAIIPADLSYMNFMKVTAFSGSEFDECLASRCGFNISSIIRHMRQCFNS